MRDVYLGWKWNRQLTAFICLVCSAASFTLKAPLFADCEMTDEQRERVAVTVAGATLVGLVAGVAWLAWGSKGKHHSSSCSSYSWSSYSDDCYTSYTWPYTYSTDYSYTNSRSSGLVSVLTNDTIYSDTENTLSGFFISNPNLSLTGRGSITPFIQFPDGSVNFLDSITFTTASTNIPFGPFNQKGTYYFGVQVDAGTTVATEITAGFLNIYVNGASVERVEFRVPAHPSANQTVEATSFQLR